MKKAICLLSVVLLITSVLSTTALAAIPTSCPTCGGAVTTTYGDWFVVQPPQYKTVGNAVYIRYLMRRVVTVRCQEYSYHVFDYIQQYYTSWELFGYT